MPLTYRDAHIAYIFPRSRKLIAAEARKRRFLETLAAWVLMLALVLVVMVAALWLATWLDKTQTTSSVSVSKGQFPSHHAENCL